MSELDGVSIHKLTTGVPGLDEVMGGGMTEYSFNLIAGAPGAGKTTLAHQIMFANASAERPALYFTIVGEPALKMIRYQQQYRFFDRGKLDGAIHYVNLSQEVLDRNLGQVHARIIEEVEARSPGLVVIDSFRSASRVTTLRETSKMELQEFTHRLAVHLTGWQTTTLVIAEFLPPEMEDNPVMTVADGVLWLMQNTERHSIVRQLQVLKVRGAPQLPGLHTFRISEEGLCIFPRILRSAEERQQPRRAERISTGVAGLDAMLGGGIPASDSVLVAGPSGSGKSVLATHFLAEGVSQGEPGVVATFEEHPQDYLERAQALGFDLEELIQQGQLELLYLRPLDLSVDETLLEIQEAVRRISARRVVIDSLSGFELALAPTFREDFRESVYRLVGALTGTGVTVLITAEITTSATELHFSQQAISFLTDDIILQRYVEIEGELQRVIVVVKMRRSPHSREIRRYEITPQGLIVGEALKEYRGIITGVADRRSPASEGEPDR